MFSSLARLTHSFKTCIMVHIRKLQYAANADMPDIVNVDAKEALPTAAKLILSGQAIALPTDTIYGVAVSAQNESAVKQLYEIKKRDVKKPIAICVGKISDVHLWGETDHLNEALLKCLLPGAVTIVLKRTPLLNPLLNPDNSKVGIRIPNYPFIQDLAKSCDIPLALTSANISSEPSPLNIEEFSHLWPSLAAVFDGGTIGGSLASREGSTVIDLSEPGYFKIVRPGSALNSTLNVINRYGLTEML